MAYWLFLKKPMAGPIPSTTFSPTDEPSGTASGISGAEPPRGHEARGDGCLIYHSRRAAIIGTATVAKGASPEVADNGGASGG